MTLGRVGYDYFRNLLQLCFATLLRDDLLITVISFWKSNRKECLKHFSSVTVLSDGNLLSFVSCLYQINTFGQV